jgi:hypothetical protein
VANKLFTKEFLTQTVNKIRTEQPIGAGSLGLKVVQEGDVRNLPTDKNLNDYAPCVFVVPIEEDLSVDPTDVNAFFYEVVYNIRVLYIDIYDVSADYLQEQLDRSNTLASIFMEDIQVYTDPAVGAKVLFNLMTNIDYNPVEKDELEDLGINRGWATSFNIQITVNQARV